VLRGLDKGWDGKRLAEFCVDIRLCKGDWIERGKGRDWGNCV